MKLHRLNLNRPLGLTTLGTLGLGLAILCAPASATAASFKVNPGESIQAAVDLAAAGDKIIILPGTYTETHGGAAAVRITKDGIKLIGKGNAKKGFVILTPGPGNLDGILVQPDVAQPDIVKSMIKGITVQGFPNNGIKVRNVDGFKILKNVSIDNLENGIQPILSANGLVKKNLAYGSDDSAMWVEGSENVRVLKNVLHTSVTGLEITISNDVIAKGNETYNNTVGIGLYHPNGASEPPIAVMRDWKVTKNWVHDNNRPNTAPPGSLAGELPPGGGILMNGVDFNYIDKNLVENNDFFGIVMIDYCLSVGGGPNDCSIAPPVAGTDAINTGNRVRKNEFINNGTNPVSHPLDSFAADIIYLTLVPTGSCFADNTFSTFAALQPSLPACP